MNPCCVANLSGTVFEKYRNPGEAGNIMNVARRQFLQLAGAAAAVPALPQFASAQPTAQLKMIDIVFPKGTWENASPSEAGWSLQKLEEARQFVQALPASSMIVVDRGRVVVEWGDPAKRVKLSSVRKSILSALYGNYVRAGRIDLNATIEQLGLYDDPPLTDEERHATLRMLLQSRSGVYHSFVGGTPDMRANKPLPGSHPPGTFWHYNNWDFNALGTVFEKQSNKRIGEAFRDEIATPIQMQDFRLEDMYYVRATDKSADFERSIHPAYQFRLTARDMARLGYLFLQGGDWNGTQVIPNSWVSESTRSYSDAGNGFGYGYLWWVNGFDLAFNSFSAWGALGKCIVVVPERALVVAFANHTEFPDTYQAMPEAEVKRLPNVSRLEMGRLLNMLLVAQRS
jgi:CubicO group peptidase (beta-lactamase class C family)